MGINLDVGVGARTFEVFEATSVLGDTGAAIILECAREAIVARGRFCIALSGGSIAELVSPKLLAAADTLNFELWHVFLADERYVPVRPNASNLGPPIEAASPCKNAPTVPSE